jgi:hypothetical protein
MLITIIITKNIIWIIKIGNTQQLLILIILTKTINRMMVRIQCALNNRMRQQLFRTVRAVIYKAVFNGQLLIED